MLCWVLLRGNLQRQLAASNRLHPAYTAAAQYELFAAQQAAHLASSPEDDLPVALTLVRQGSGAALMHSSRRQRAAWCDLRWHRQAGVHH